MAGPSKTAPSAKPRVDIAQLEAEAATMERRAAALRASAAEERAAATTDRRRQPSSREASGARSTGERMAHDSSLRRAGTIHHQDNAVRSERPPAPIQPDLNSYTIGRKPVGSGSRYVAPPTSPHSSRGVVSPISPAAPPVPPKDKPVRSVRFHESFDAPASRLPRRAASSAHSSPADNARSWGTIKESYRTKEKEKSAAAGKRRGSHLDTQVTRSGKGAVLDGEGREVGLVGQVEAKTPRYERGPELRARTGIICDPFSDDMSTDAPEAGRKTKNGGRFAISVPSSAEAASFPVTPSTSGRDMNSSDTARLSPSGRNLARSSSFSSVKEFVTSPVESMHKWIQNRKSSGSSPSTPTHDLLDRALDKVDRKLRKLRRASNESFVCVGPDHPRSRSPSPPAPPSGFEFIEEADPAYSSRLWSDKYRRERAKMDPNYSRWRKPTQPDAMTRDLMKKELLKKKQ